ncbi:MAG: diguanylate cyclase [candidate division Zixibacteria bacterium]|nr:diguanylate cyclase [candidate division Zixibacteria bacterium]
MQSTENITLESWPVSNADRADIGTVYHFAVRQTGVDLDFHLRQFFRNEKASFHFFDDFASLILISRRFPLCAIVMGSRTTLAPEIELLQAIKFNVFLSIIPVILFHPEPDNATVIAAFQNGVEEFIYGEWVEKLVEVRVRRVISRSRRDLSVNPSTRLPGPTMIEEEIQRQLERGDEIAVCYADLDNFKAYNDYYGYAFGDRIIRLTAQIVRDIVFDCCREGFVGHIAGDDFIFVIPRNLVEKVCPAIIKCFDAIIPYRYAEADRDRGFISTANRRGEMESYPILTISIAVVINENRTFHHMGEMSKMLADLKKAAKQLPGSNYLIERRKKY